MDVLKHYQRKGDVNMVEPLELLEAIQNETQPIDGHKNPKAIQEYWKDVYEMLEGKRLFETCTTCEGLGVVAVYGDLDHGIEETSETCTVCNGLGYVCHGWEEGQLECDQQLKEDIDSELTERMSSLH